MAATDPTRVMDVVDLNDPDQARRVALFHETSVHTNRARVICGETTDGPTRLAAILDDLSYLAREVGEAPRVLPRKRALDVAGQLLAWVEATDRLAAR